MANIDDVPAAVPDAGQSFDYVNPPRFATLVLVDSPLDPDHSNIGVNPAAYDAFIDGEVAAGRALVVDNVNLVSPEDDLRIQVEYETTGQFFNYGRLTIGTRKWYVFYTPEYLNKSVTLYRADIDEVASYDWSLGYSIIERGHVAVAASQSDTYGSQYLTAPEPIDAPPVQGVLTQSLLASTPSAWTVLVISANDLRGSGGLRFFELHSQADKIMTADQTASAATITHDGVVQITVPPASYPWTEGGSGGDNPEVAIPFVTPSPVSTIDGVAAGGGVYLFTPSGFAEYMTIMQGAPWVTAGIVDVRLVPSWAVGGGGDHGFTPAAPSTDPGSTVWGVAGDIPNFVGAVTSATTSPTVLAGWRDTVLAEFGAGYYRKLITSQFTELMVGNGDSWQTFRPDQWQSSGLGFEAATGAAHGDPSIRLIPTGYNGLGSQLGIDSPVGGNAGVTHSGYGSAASNPGSQDLTPYLNAFSSHQTWLVNQLNRELAVTLGLTNIQLNAGVQGIQTVLGAAAGAAGGALAGGGGAGAIAGAASSSIGSMAGLATAGITASNTITMLDISQDGSFDIGAYQLGLSGLAAVSAFDTWSQSLYSASGGGSAEHLASAWRAIVSQAFTAIVSMPSAERVKALLSEWKRYGYMIGQAFAPSRLDVMSKMSYWQTDGATILGPVPQQHRRTIAQVFDKGTTVWTNLADIGTDVTASNEPVAGITY